MTLEDHYRAAMADLRRVGAHAVARRWEDRGPRSLDRTPTCRAVMAAVDAVDARRAARTDPENAACWTAIAADQRRLARGQLAAALAECRWRQRRGR